MRPREAMHMMCFKKSFLPVVRILAISGGGALAAAVALGGAAPALAQFQGACCKQGVCTFVAPDICSANGGDFQGFGVPCDSNSCPPVGACCFNPQKSDCEVLTSED